MVRSNDRHDDNACDGDDDVEDCADGKETISPTEDECKNRWRSLETQDCGSLQDEIFKGFCCYGYLGHVTKRQFIG